MRKIALTVFLIAASSAVAQQAPPQAGGSQQVLEEMSAKLSQLIDLQIKGNFLLQCCALTLGLLWGGLTWRLVVLSKNEREFF